MEYFPGVSNIDSVSESIIKYPSFPVIIPTPGYLGREWMVCVQDSRLPESRPTLQSSWQFQKSRTSHRTVAYIQGPWSTDLFYGHKTLSWSSSIKSLTIIAYTPTLLRQSSRSEFFSYSSYSRTGYPIEANPPSSHVPMRNMSRRGASGEGSRKEADVIRESAPSNCLKLGKFPQLI